MEANDVGIVTGGTILWLVAFVALLPFHGWLSKHGDTKWLWTCLAGFGLGLIGIWYCRGRRAAIARSVAQAAEAASEGDAASAGEDGGSTDGPSVTRSQAETGGPAARQEPPA